MLLVIFGAGASYDSADRERLRVTRGLLPPPLARDLVDERFNNIAAQLPNSLPIIDRLRHRMGRDPAAFSLESELAKITEASLESAERRQQLAAFRFYLHRVIRQSVGEWMEATSGFTRYLTLLNYIHDWHRQTGTPVRLATFNYDVLLDSAASALIANWRLTQLEDYVNRPDFRLFKLHGSTTWSRVYPFDQSTNPLLAAMELAAADQLAGGDITANYPTDNMLIAGSSLF